MTLGLVFELVILASAVLFVGFYIYTAKKSGKAIPWEKIRPILTNTFIEIQRLNEVEKMGYNALEDYAVLKVREQILRADFLTKEERALISDDLIRNILGPRLKEIHESLKAK